MNFVFGKRDPKFLELSVVLLDVERVIDDKDVLLVVGSSLVGPVEAAC